MSDPGVQAVRIGIPLIGYTKYTEPLPGILYRTKKTIITNKFKYYRIHTQKLHIPKPYQYKHI